MSEAVKVEIEKLYHILYFYERSLFHYNYRFYIL